MISPAFEALDPGPASMHAQSNKASMVCFSFTAHFSFAYLRDVAEGFLPSLRPALFYHQAARLSASLSLGASIAAAMIFTASPGRKG